MFSHDGYEIPIRLIALTGADESQFVANSEGQCAELQGKVGLLPHHSVLEIGCGVGRCAIALARFLEPPGSYVGIDIIAESIAWAQKNIGGRHPHFTFLHVDLKDDLHNPHGKGNTTDFTLPVADASIDRVVLWSVFTHLYREEIEHYLREFRRVLKPGGLVWASCFVITDDVLAAARRTEQTAWSLRFENPPEKGCYINIMQVPRGAIGYAPEAWEDMIRQSGLRMHAPFVKGAWSGLHAAPESGQDGIILAHACET